MRRRDESYPFIEFCSDIAHFQIELNRYFIIEKPETSQIWNTRLMQSLAEMEGVHRSTVHMCAYGLKDPNNGLHMKKPMSFLHNIPMSLFFDVVKTCPGTHQHQQIIGSAPGHGSRAILSQVYPVPFCRQLAGVLAKIKQTQTVPTEPCTPAVDQDLIGQWEDLWDELCYEQGETSTIATTNENVTVIPAMP